MMVLLKLLLLSLLLLSVIISCGVSGVSIHVDGNRGVANTTCCPKSNVSIACKTLNLALQCARVVVPSDAPVTILVSAGTYTLANDRENSVVKGRTGGFTIIGNCSDCVSISCDHSGAGLTFINADNVRLENLTFSWCGVPNNSTSRCFTLCNDDFVTVVSALYFLLCRNVTLSHVTVQDTQGTGVVMYSTVGTNTITHSTFSSNHPNSSYLGGGGLYIEFAYCYPGNNSCFDGPSNIPEAYTRDAVFNIYNCTFSDNLANVSDAFQYTFILPQKSYHIAFGRGGGLSLYFKGKASNNVVNVEDCTFSNNTALWGGGVFMSLLDNSTENIITVSNSSFLRNECLFKTSSSSGTGGGGARIGFISFNDAHVRNNSIQFQGSEFSENSAFFGGGVSFYASRVPTESTPTNSLNFLDTKWSGNVARAGSGADLSVWHPVPSGAVSGVVFNNCSFINNSGDYTSEQSTVVGIGGLYSDSIPVTFDGDNYFTGNTHSAVAAVTTGIYLTCNSTLHFVKNSGRHGGAVALLGDAFLQTHENSALKFINNTAVIAGGAIYHTSVSEHELMNSRNCFLRYSDITITPEKWTSSFFFSGNVVNDRFESIFASSLLTCQWGGTFGNSSDDLSNVFCWNDMWDYQEGHCLTQVRTSPAKFESKSNYKITTFPGQRRSMHLTMLDDRGTVVTNSSVFTAKSQTTQLEVDASSLYISDNHIDIHPISGKGEINGTVLLETIEPRVIQVLLNVTIYPCPPGMVHTSGGVTTPTSCRCGGNFDGLLHCSETSFRTEIQRGNWIGTYTYNGKSKVVVAGMPYFTPSLNETYIQLPRKMTKLDKVLCGDINREGTLCGKCKKEYGPSIHTRHCVKCNPYYMWTLYLISQYLPLTLLFIIVIALDIRITSAPANAFIFFAQVFPTVFIRNGGSSISYSHTGNYILDVYTFLYNIWNLQFFQLSICLSPRLSSLGAIAVNYLEAMYPLVLIGVVSLVIWMYERGFRGVVFLCRPFHTLLARFQQRWNIQRSLIHAFASFILLSYSRFVRVSFLLLTTIQLVTDNGNEFGPKYGVLAFDGSIPFLSPDHTPYFILSLVVLSTFVLVTPLLLILPSAWRNLNIVRNKWSVAGRCLSWLDRCSVGAWPKLNSFQEAFHGCYRNGTNTSRRSVEFDYRWIAGFYLILRVILFAFYAFTPGWLLQFCFLQLICTAALLVFINLRPYKKDFYNKLDATMFALLLGINTITMFCYTRTLIGKEPSLVAFSVQYVLVLLPLLYVSFVFLKHSYRFCSRLKCWSLKNSPERDGLISSSHIPGSSNEGPLTQSGSHDYLSFMEETGRLGKINVYRPVYSTITENSKEDMATLSREGDSMTSGTTQSTCSPPPFHTKSTVSPTETRYQQQLIEELMDEEEKEEEEDEEEENSGSRQIKSLLRNKTCVRETKEDSLSCDDRGEGSN